MRRRSVARRRAAAWSLALALALTAGCGGEESSPTSEEPTNSLEIVSWWTSGSEQEALNVLLDAYRTAHAGVEVTNATVVGGGGSNAQVVLAQRLLGGDPPDSWQTFPGQALSRYVAANQVADVSEVYSGAGLASALPRVIGNGLTVDGKQYGVPTSAHRGNVLFYNRELLEQADVEVPGTDYTAAAFLDDLNTLDEAGVTPLCLGAKDRFTTAALFENVLLGVVGEEGWTAIRSDRFDWGGSQAREALDRFGTLLDRADPQAAGLSWDEATRKLADGGCAFETMNDSAYGELVKAGAVDGTDFGAVPYPGTGSAYVAVVDTFVVARNAANARNAVDFLATIATPETQLAFSKAKGSVPVRTDVNVSSMLRYQQSAAEALRSRTIVWSIVHGSLMSPQFQTGFYDAVETYVRSRDPKAFSRTLTDAMRRQPPAK
ncbi:MAG: ABC transporter substrate-binding protein [Actinomycetes bacterium]